MTATDSTQPGEEDDVLFLPEEEEKGPERRCLVSGVSGPADRLIRFVAGPDGVVVPDLDGRLPGRGFWLSAKRDVVNTAVTRKLFSRGAKRAVTAPPGLADLIAALLLKRCQDTIGLARRAGQAVAGFEKVCAALKENSGGIVLAAYDGAADGRDKIEALARTRPLISVLGREELGAAFGRFQAVHAWIAAGKLAARLQTDCQKLSGFRDELTVDIGRTCPPSESKANQ